jgi:hypothetical protein
VNCYLVDREWRGTGEVDCVAFRKTNARAERKIMFDLFTLEYFILEHAHRVTRGTPYYVSEAGTRAMYLIFEARYIENSLPALKQSTWQFYIREGVADLSGRQLR